MTTIWTEDRLEKAIELFNFGWSFAEIAKQIGTTRNSVIAKISRMGLKRGFVKAQPAKSARHDRQAELPTPVLPEPVGNNDPVPFLYTSDHHCRAILDERDEQGGLLCCGKPKARGSSWCNHHYGLYLQPERGNGQAGPCE